MKKVLVGTMIVMALITGCSEENDPKPLTCEQATAEYKAAFDDHYAKQDYYSRNMRNATLAEREQMKKASDDAYVIRIEKQNAMKTICGTN